MDSSFFLTAIAATTIGFFTLLFYYYRIFRFHQANKTIDSSSSSLSPSSPLPPSIHHNWKHHVFPSFHGADVRKAFLSHILKEFRSKGIDPFIDNNIERSKSIGPELIEAIRGSRIAIVLLSKNYASSTWCLNELVEILKCREKLGQIVMIVFYQVDPTDVKKQTGEFGKVFKRVCKGKTKEDISRWRHALAEVAKIAGYHSSNWDDEAAMIEKIATDISNKLNIATPSRDFDGFIGMGVHMERMKLLLRLELDEVRMIGIWGPPGIGKSTIARFLHNQLSNSFQLSALMVDIKGYYPRPCLDEYNAQLQLQKQMLSQMINQKDIMISHLGVAQERLKDKKVFLVLDDVDRLGQLDALAKEVQWFGPGSRIIVTTEDLRVLKAHGIDHIYKVTFPSSDEALQIFCMYAFGRKSPKDGYTKLAHVVTYLVGKLPLGLKVMGSYFRGMSKKEWENALPRLMTSLDGEIESILKFSFDALCDEDKDLFLHIACLFNRGKFERVVEYLSMSFSDVRQGLRVLAEKSLIYIEDGYIRMHNLLAQLGKEIVRKQSVREPGQRQFLVDAKDICEVFTDDYTTVTRNVIGIDFSDNMTGDELNISERAFVRMPNLQFLRSRGDLDDDTTVLSLLERLNYISPKLRLLHWEFSSMTSLPFIVNPKFLVELIMCNSKLEKLWEGIKPLQNLKWMDLSSSVNLKELPNLSTATTLKELNLSGCSSLVKLPSSIGNATSLMNLNLGHCSSLVELPYSIGNATNIKELNLNGCSNLLELPSSIGNATNLKELNLIGCTSLVEIPCSIGSATNLKKLYLFGCSSLVKLPSSIGNLHNLQDLYLSRCSSLVELPSSIGNLNKLEKINLKGCSKLEVLPTNINLESLSDLDLTGCLLIKKFPEISTNIKLLKLSGTAIEKVPLAISSWSRLTQFDMSYSENLKDLPHALHSITELHLTNTEIQELGPWVKGFSRLRVLVLNGMHKLKSLPQLPDSLLEVDAECCESMERLDCSFHNPMTLLNFSKCFKLNQEARDLIIQTSIIELAVLPGREVPTYFSYRAYGSSTTVKLNQKPLCTSKKFRACVLLDYKGETAFCGDWEEGWVDCSITSKHNSLTACSLMSNSHNLHPILTEHLYIFEVEAEEVTTTELVFEFELDSDTITNSWMIKECGILQL